MAHRPVRAAAMSLQTMASRRGSRPARRRVRADTPALRLVMFEVLPPGNPAEEHRLCNPPLLRTDGKVDVGDDEADEAHTRQTVHDVGHAPGPVAEEIWVTREE